MKPPKWFETQLNAEHDHHYRIRWSDARKCWAIEEKSHRGSFSAPPLRPDEDDKIRARDGFSLVFEVHARPEGTCPECGSQVQLLPYEIGESKCGFCGNAWVACWWPLDSSLLEHIRYLDPLRGGLERVERDVDRANYKKALSERRARQNLTESAWKEDYNKVVGIASVAYGGVKRYEG